MGQLSDYTFEFVTSGHTIEVVFARYADYFGMQPGSSYRYASKGSPTAGQAEVLEIDTTSFSEPLYVVQERAGDGTVSQSWYWRAPDGLRLQRADEGSHRLELSEPVLMIKPSPAGNENWASETTACIDGTRSSLRLDAPAARLF